MYTDCDTYDEGDDNLQECINVFTAAAAAKWVAKETTLNILG